VSVPIRVEDLAGRLASIDGVEAVALGGSRAQGREREGSDWDFALYYRGDLDVDGIRRLGFPGTVVEPGEWAYPMNGGAWLTIEGEKVDLLYRDLDHVERWTDRARQGEWDLFRVPGYLAGMASYVLVGEAALGKVVAGELDRPEFPAPLRDRGPDRWRWETAFALDRAAEHAVREDPGACLGVCALAIVATAQGRMLERTEWVLNEKGLVGRAGLAEEASLLRSRTSLPGLVEELRARLGTKGFDVRR
jgi:predicted nucleotidyltransferase